MKKQLVFYCAVLGRILLAITLLSALPARAQEPIKQAPPEMSADTKADTKAERLRLLDAEIARIQDDAIIIRNAVGWSLMGLGIGVMVLGTAGLYASLDDDNSPGELDESYKAVAFILSLVFGVSIGSIILGPGALTYGIPTNDEDMPKEYFRKRDQQVSIEDQLARAESTLQQMSESARLRRLALAWSLAGVGTVAVVSIVSGSLGEYSSPSTNAQAAGYSALLFGGLATWQFLTTWDSEDTWAAFQNNELPQLESSHFQWALSPSVTADGDALLSFALIY